MDLRIVWNEFGQDTPETQRIFAEGRAYPVLAGGGRVAFVEDQIDHLQHGGQTGGKIGPAGDLKRNARLGEGALGPDDALGDGRLRDEEGARDLLRRQTSKKAKREHNTCLGRENRMAGDEHEAQKVIPDIIVERGVEIRHSHLLLRLELAAKLLVFALQPLVSAEHVDRTVFGGGHEPSAWVVRDA